MISPRDGWMISRLLNGEPLNGEVATVSDDVRNVAASLAALQPEDRPSAWEGFLTDREDRGEIQTLLAGIDPTGPEPETDFDDWGPIRFGGTPAVEPFPLDVLPYAARSLAEAAARSISCPVDFPAVATLAAASAMIGRSASLLVKDGRYEPASLFVAIVGGPSAGKSPALNAALKPIWELSNRLHQQHREEVQDWKQRNDDERGEEPMLQRISTSDPTTEALAHLLALNPRGMVLCPDEMTKWVLSMDQYKGGKGGDRPFYLSVWGGQSAVIDRAKNPGHPIVVPHPYLTIVGGMTPDMLSSLSEGRGREDGFLARLLFSYPDTIRKFYSDEGIPPDVALTWAEMLESLWDRPMEPEEGGSVPHVVQMTPPARKRWAEWCQSHYDEMQDDSFPNGLEGAWGKLETYGARLTLILHLMHLAADPTNPTIEPPPVPDRIVENALRLTAYFKSHARRIYSAMGSKNETGSDDVKALLKWLIGQERRSFSLRDVARNFNRFKENEGALEDAVDWMVERNLLRPIVTSPSPSKPGRKRSPTFEGNPALWTSPQFRRFRRDQGHGTHSVGSVGNAVIAEECPR